MKRGHFSPFGTDRFGRWAERFARFFGTPKFILGQTLVVLLWIAVNVIAISFRWDPYPFIALNLLFSLQAAYAAPLILLAQTRQADRDKAHAEESERHREELHAQVVELLKQNTELTQEVHELTDDIHRRVT